MLWLPMISVAQTSKPKTLKELVAEEKARKEAEKAAKAAEEKASSRPSPEGKGERSTTTTPEEAADIVTETDSAIWAPTNVKQLGIQNYGELTQPSSSLDLRDPANIDRKSTRLNLQSR